MTDKSEILFIRACKSKDPDKRIRSVYKRFYWVEVTDEEIVHYLINILSGIADKYHTLDMAGLIRKLDDYKMYATIQEKEYDYKAAILYAIVSSIRLTKADIFPPEIKTAWFRDRK